MGNSKPYKLVSRETKKENTEIIIKDVCIGGDELVVIAGPCAIESKNQMLETAIRVKASGAKVLRGGAYKPRTSPYSFQGLEQEGLQILKDISQETGLLTISEVIDEKSIDLAVDFIDILQIGSRNMQNFHLLKVAGQTGKPILLKRGLAATIEEWLMAAEYILAEGNNKVILCERGIRTFETATRNTLDISAIPLVKNLTHLPIIVDPSHASGKRSLVLPLTKAAIAAGSDGLIIEVHPNPHLALCDGTQSLNCNEFHELMQDVKALSTIMDRRIAL